MRPTVAVLGVGSMGQTLIHGLQRAGWGDDELAAAVRRRERVEELRRLLGLEALVDAARAAEGRDVIVVSVKPRDVPALINQIQPVVTPAQMIVSLVAGVPISVYEKAFPDVPVVRAMPNTPAAVDEGMTAYCGGTRVDEAGLDRAASVLAAVGETINLSEDLLDAVTAVSGTGPAYVFLLAEALTEAAIREGLPHHAAERLVDQTVRGAGILLAGSEKSAFRLRAEVTSPGGTTAAAMHTLENGGFRALLEDAVRSAASRSRELGAETIVSIEGN